MGSGAPPRSVGVVWVPCVLTRLPAGFGLLVYCPFGILPASGAAPTPGRAVGYAPGIDGAVEECAACAYAVAAAASWSTILVALSESQWKVNCVFGVVLLLAADADCWRSD